MTLYKDVEQSLIDFGQSNLVIRSNICLNLVIWFQIDDKGRMEPRKIIFSISINIIKFTVNLVLEFKEQSFIFL